ncbi:MAG: DUF2798 domain-containing protein [Lysobacterales bacterium]
MSPRSVQLLIAALLSGLMSATVAMVSTIRGFGFAPDLIARWLHAWSVSWPVAFTVLILVGPPVRRLAARLGRVDSELK